MLGFWSFICILGLTVASPINTDRKALREAMMSEDAAVRNNALENLLLGLIEDLRQTMINGSDGIPVLDPLNVPSVRVGDDIIPIPGAYLNLNGLTVDKLSSFVVDSLSVSSTSIILQRYRVNFDFYVPDLEVEADAYELAVSALGVYLSGQGEAKINLRPRIIGSLVIGPRITIGNGLFLSIFSSEVSFRLEDIDLAITGLLVDDDDTAAFINIFLKYLIMDAVVMYERDITAFLSTTVQEVGNSLLQDINVSDILG